MATLFARLLDARFDQLPPCVRALHARETTHTYIGCADVERGRGWLSRCVGAATRLPHDGAAQTLHLTIEPTARGENWTRQFAGRAMPSRLWDSGGMLRERLGLAIFGFLFDLRDGELIWKIASVRVLGIPLPARSFVGVVAREFERDGRYRFEVRAELPFVGLLVHYRGWLDVE